IIAGHASLDLLGVLNRMGGIADVLVKGSSDARCRRRGIEAEAAPSLKKQRSRPDVPRWPGLERPPLVGAGLEDPGFRELRGPPPLQVVLKEWELDLLAEEIPRLGVEGDVSERCAVSPGPAAVPPWAHHQDVRRPGARTLDLLVGFKGAEQILG